MFLLIFRLDPHCQSNGSRYCIPFLLRYMAGTVSCVKDTYICQSLVDERGRILKGCLELGRVVSAGVRLIWPELDIENIGYFECPSLDGKYGQDGDEVHDDE